jgi:glycosyltransferase involved in cell wall biosynthesis
MTLVSVILPVHNGARFLAEAMQSVLDQTYGAFELIVVDDGSTDATGEIVTRFMRQDERVRLIRQPNQGVSVARNTALEAARAEWIACLDHDDVMLAHRLERQLAFVEAHPEVKAFGTLALYINARGEVVGQTVPVPLRSRADLGAWLATGRAIGLNQPSVMMSRSAVLAVGGYNPQMRVAQDIDLWMRLAQAGHLVLQQDEVLTKYRVHPGSVTVNFPYESHRISEWAMARARARRLGLPEPDLEAFEAEWTKRPLLSRVEDRRQRLGWVRYRRAGTALSNGLWAAGLWNLSVAFCLRPLYVARRLALQLLKTDPLRPGDAHLNPAGTRKDAPPRGLEPR